MKCLRLIMTLSIIAFIGCDDDPEQNPDGFAEFVVDIEGNWKIDQVLQNGNDITALMDFQSFSLQLDYENGEPSSFSFPNQTVPFVLSDPSGDWSFDDPVYPTKINFSDGASLDIQGAVLSGSDKMTVIVPLGCSSNTYTYTLSK
ncbi:DUF5004 domain-containing protein [Allomuricauda sp. XS_ASV26]|uniref:DUF5004 domain-containing protein n=1 Tax=Allomuricauda sp. XS_ASV26 TaxID=3241292 RepID=UPI0035179F26